MDAPPTTPLGAEPAGKRSHRMTHDQRRAHRRRRFRRHGRRAYIRSAYSLPSLATLGNAVCGFGAMYVAGLAFIDPSRLHDNLTRWFAQNSFTLAAYLIFLAMLFDALDGRLARFTRHTTDFGGQLDSLADVISFGCAPAFLALQLFRFSEPDVHVFFSRLIWAVGALYMSCAAMRLARFNVSNEHGEQHHYSFLGLPSPGAGGTVAAFVLMQQAMLNHAEHFRQKASHQLAAVFANLADACVWLLPAIVLLTGLLMVSGIRYPHIVNRYLRGKKSIWTIIALAAVGLGVIVAHKYTLALGTLYYVLSPLLTAAYHRLRPRPVQTAPHSAA
jgi:CDP-diacylglycerol--serine O-phosphatidyltransferase